MNGCYGDVLYVMFMIHHRSEEIYPQITYPFSNVGFPLYMSPYVG